MKSGDLAKELGKSQNSITNRLPAMEKLGLIVRSKVGKNSVVYVTPKGRGIAKDLPGMEIPDACKVFAADKSMEEQPFIGLLGEEVAPGEPMSFWFSPSAGHAQSKTSKASSTCSKTGTYH
jgi:DNA-binding MarR family transcriptional regulator